MEPLLLSAGISMIWLAWSVARRYWLVADRLIGLSILSVMAVRYLLGYVSPDWYIRLIDILIVSIVAIFTLLSDRDMRRFVLGITRKRGGYRQDA